MQNSARLKCISGLVNVRLEPHVWQDSEHYVQKTDRAIVLEMLYTRSWLQVRGAEVAQPGSTRKWEAKESTRCPIWAGEAEDLSGLIPG